MEEKSRNKVVNVFIRLNIVAWMIIQAISVCCILGGAIGSLYYLNEGKNSDMFFSLVLGIGSSILIPLIYMALVTMVFYIAGYGFNFHIKELE